MRNVLTAAALALALSAGSAAAYTSADEIAHATENGSKTGAVGLCEDWGKIKYGQAYSIARWYEANGTPEFYQSFKRAYNMGRKTRKVYLAEFDRFYPLSCRDLNMWIGNFWTWVAESENHEPDVSYE
jgi:hypothetical protein